MHRPIALALAIAWSVPAFAQGQPEIQVPETPPPAAAPAPSPAPAVPAAAPAPAAPPTVTGDTPPAAPAAAAPAAVPLTVTGDAGRSGPAVQQPADPKEIIVESDSPHTDRGEGNRVRLPPPGPGRQAFLKDYIRVDPRANAPFVGTDFLSAKEFYGRLGRTDLVAASDSQTAKRIWLMSAATLVTVAGVAGGVMILGNAQSLNDPRCFANGNVSYNDCVNRANETTLLGGLIIGLAVAVGGGILTWALLTPEMVTPPEETVRLATEYNRKLAVRHGAPEGAQLQFLPSVGPKGASLSFRLSF
jgi:hypothetical protein